MEVIDLFKGQAKSCSFLMFARSFFIMAKYNDKGWAVDGDHEIIYASGVSFGQMNEDDANALRAWGWHQHDLDVLARHV